MNSNTKYFISSFRGRIQLILNRGSVWPLYGAPHMILRAFFCNLTKELITYVGAALYTWIPYIRWLCTSAKYRLFRALGERTFFTMLMANSELAILLHIFDTWNLKFNLGSRYTPRNFTAGSDELQCIRSILIFKLSKSSSSLLLLIYILKSSSAKVCSFALKIIYRYLVFFGWRAILWVRKKDTTIYRDVTDIRPDNPAFFISVIRPHTGLHCRIYGKNGYRISG
jgi:hypothetical protein